MQIDYAFILSAGLGTRMGEIGKKWPKPLWPIFNKTLLELQVDYCHERGIKHIFINTHFLAREVEEFLKSDQKFADIIVLYENPLLDSGGGIHNMASHPKVNYLGNVLLINADQFFFFDEGYFKNALAVLKSSRAVLFGIKVGKGDKYNETIVIKGRLTEIGKPSDKESYVTYSGLGVLKLDGLARVKGASKFFETVANYKNENVQFIVPENFEYWDFGTAEIYFKSIKKIYSRAKERERGHLLDFLSRYNAFDGSEERFFNQKLNSINIDGLGDFTLDSIVGKGLVQKL